MATKYRLQNNENPNRSHRFPDYTVVYFKLIAPDLVTVCQIGAYYEENSFSRHVCLNRTFGEMTEKQTNIFTKACIRYSRGELVVIVCKMDAWKDFLKFLQSANNSVVLVTHGGHDDCFLMFRDLSELSLMEEFRNVCVGVIDTLLLCQDIFPGRKKYKLKELVKDKLGEENASGYQNATADAINLEKLMKYAKVEPEMFQQHFFSLADLEYWCELKRERLLMKAARAKMTSSMETGEDSSTSLLSGRMKTRNTEVSATSEITPDVSKQVAAKEMTTKDCLPNGSHRFPDYTVVYFNLIAPDLVTVCQIGAHFEENSFSRHVCPNGTFTEKAAKRMGLSNKDGILYLGGERVETVSKTDAWKDFLKFLQSASNSVVLVVHDKHPDCFLLLRELSKLSLMEEFRKVCVGVIDTLLLCRDIFPGRNNYKLKELVKENLGEENASGCQNATVNAISVEKLMKYAKVEPEMFQQHLFSLADLEYWCELRRERLLRKAAKKEARAKMTSSMETGEDSSASLLSGRMKTRNKKVSATSEITLDVSKQERQFAGLDLQGGRQKSTNRYVPPHIRKKGLTEKIVDITDSDLERSYVADGEDGSAVDLSGRMTITNPETIREEKTPITPLLELPFAGSDLQGGCQQSTGSYVPPHLRKKVAAQEMTTNDSLQNSLTPRRSRHLFEHTLVYFNSEATGFEGSLEVFQIGAHFMDKIFSKYMCPSGPIVKTVTKLTGLSKKDDILYLGGERVETVSKMDAWKDFLKFLQSTNNRAVLVIHNRNKDCSLLLRELSELSLMEEFRKVCAGVINTLPLCKNIFPGREEIGKNYKLKELVQDILGKEIPVGSHSAIVDAINLEKLMKHANVQPEIFQQHFFSLSNLENWYQKYRQTMLLRNIFPLMSLGQAKEIAKAGLTYSDLVRSYLEGGEDGIASFLSHRMKITDQTAFLKEINAITPVLEQQFAGLDLQGGRQQSTDRYVPPHLRKKVSADEMTTKGILQKNDNPTGGHHSSENKLVYLALKANSDSEICHIGAHFMEKIFSRFVCPIGGFTKGDSKRTGLSKKNGILYLGKERVVTVSKMDAWEDFLKFLQSANGSVTLVVHDRHNDCFLLFRELSQLSLMEEFRKVCAGVIYTLPLCRNVFPGREKIGKNYKLKELVQDNLGKEMSVGSHNAIVDTINLEKLMKHANVQPEIFQKHFFPLSSLEYQYQIKREARLLKKKFHFKKRRAEKMAEAGITCNDLERSYIEAGEDGIASVLSGKINNNYPNLIRKKAIAITQILNREHHREHP